MVGGVFIGEVRGQQGDIEGLLCVEGGGSAAQPLDVPLPSLPLAPLAGQSDKYALIVIQ